MRNRAVVLAAWLLLGIVAVCSLVQASTPARSRRSRKRHLPPPPDLHIAPDLEQRLARYKIVEMPFNRKGLSVNEQRMIEKLVDAGRQLESIYWRQSDPKALALYTSLLGPTNPKLADLKRYLMINGSRYDLLSENQPFVGTDPYPPGHAFYPQGITKEEIAEYVKQHPEEKGAIYSPYTIVERDGAKLKATPYHVAFKAFLDAAADDLRQAADLSTDPAFAKFLRLRADALLSDDYYLSDLAWLDLDNPKFDIIFAPYETYLDDLLGVKTSYGVAVMVRNEEQSQKLAVFKKYVPELQEALPLDAANLPSVRGHASPMEVMDTPFRAGDLRHGYQAVADNLPNDARIHAEKGTKKIFFKNFMDARVNYIILPLAKQVMQADQAAMASGDGYLASTMMHEICHGLGPAFARTSDGQKDIREVIGPAYSGLEEAKADVVGMFGLNWLVEKGALPKERLPEYYASYVAGIFRTVRFGAGEAHGRAEMMEFNYLVENGAIVRNPDGKYAVVFDKMPGTIAALAKQLLEMEATGDRARAESWFAKYDVIPGDLKNALDQVQGVPVDIDPVSVFPDVVK